jgi:hypothetical protein
MILILSAQPAFLDNQLSTNALLPNSQKIAKLVQIIKLILSIMVNVYLQPQALDVLLGIGRIRYA